LNFILIAVCVTLGSVGQILFKVGVNAANTKGIATAPIIQKILTYLVAPQVLLGLLCYSVATVLWIYLLSRVPVSWAYPFLGLTYVAVLFLSAIILGEKITTLHFVATAIIWFGVFMLVRVPV